MKNQIIFAKEKESSVSSGDYWKVLIADDEDDVHIVTKMVLEDLDFKGGKIKFYDATNGEEAKKLLKEHDDFALILLDVVMEKDNSGLEVVEYIRNVLKNKIIRIVLRTGQPEEAPEEKVVMDYDINDYCEKTELTAQKLQTVIFTALRSYNDLTIILDLKNNLDKKVYAQTAELRKANEQLKLREFELKKSVSRMEHEASLGALSAGIAHDFNNIISVLAVYSVIDFTINKMKEKLSPKSAEMCEDDFNRLHRLSKDISSTMHTGMELCRAIVDFAKGISEPKKEQSIEEIMQVPLHLYERTIKVGEIKVVKNIQPVLPLFFCNRGDMQRLFLNLIVNSIQAMAKVDTPVLQISLSSADNHFLICVEDNGVGIPEDLRVKIFESKFTTKGDSGSGIGLVTVKQIVDSYNGIINVESTLGKRTIFEIKLPLNSP